MCATKPTYCWFAMTWQELPKIYHSDPKTGRLTDRWLRWIGGCVLISKEEQMRQKHSGRAEQTEMGAGIECWDYRRKKKRKREE